MAAKLMSMREALGEAMNEELERDPKVFLMGEEVAEYDGAYKVSKGLLEKFGPKRIVDSPISEGGFAGLGVGAAMAGLKPIIEMMTWNFGIQAFDQIINHAAKMNYMSGGQFGLPIVFRGPNGAAHMLGSQHSQNVDPMLSNVPGLKVVSVATPADAKGLLKSAIRDPNPVIVLESEMLYGLKGEVPTGEHLVPLGKGVKRSNGDDVTVITWGKVSHLVQKTLAPLKEANIAVDLIDIRSLVPLDEELIYESVRRSNRVVIVEENWPISSFGSHISDIVQRHCFDYLDAPIAKVSQENIPVPYAEELERAALPTEHRIIETVKHVCYR